MYKDASRALSRGLGPAQQAGEFALEALLLPENSLKIERADKPWWLAAGVDAIHVSCAWLLREVESGAAFLDAVSFEPHSSGPCGIAAWNLPASKTDFMALG